MTVSTWSPGTWLCSAPVLTRCHHCSSANDTGLLRPPHHVVSTWLNFPFPLPQGNSFLMSQTATPLWKLKFLISFTIPCSLPEAGEWNKAWFELEFPCSWHSLSTYLFFSHYGSWPQYSNCFSLFSTNLRRLSCCFAGETSQKYFVTSQHEKYLTKHWGSFITWCGNQLLPGWQMQTAPLSSSLSNSQDPLVQPLAVALKALKHLTMINGLSGWSTLLSCCLNNFNTPTISDHNRCWGARRVMQIPQNKFSTLQPAFVKRFLLYAKGC